MVNFIILTTQRSGSTMLGSCLNSHPRIECFGEVFLPAQHIRDDERYFTYHHYYTASLGRRLQHLVNRRTQVLEFLDWLFGTAQSQDVAGFKLPYNHMNAAPGIMDWIKDQDVRIVHLVRRNLLKGLISGYTSVRRHVAHSTAPLDKKLLKARINVRWLMRALKRRDAEISHYTEWVKAYHHHQVVYEEFVADREKHTRPLLEFLGIREFRPLTTDLVKLNPESLSTFVENYDELATAIKGTKFERHLT